MKQQESSQRLARLSLAILAKIRLHKQGNPILSRNLQEEFQIDNGKVCEVVRMLRREGWPIASFGGETPGYYFAESYGELEPTINNFKSLEADLRNTRLAMMKKFDMHEGLFA